MNTKRILFALVGSLLFVFLSNMASACPSLLYCSNFTEQKNRDCNYILSQGFDKNDQKELLCQLWDGNYGFDEYTPKEYQIIIDLSLKAEDISLSKIILAGKIFLFGLFNYLIFSTTKLKVLAKWLTVA